MRRGLALLSGLLLMMAACSAPAPSSAAKPSPALEPSPAGRSSAGPSAGQPGGEPPAASSSAARPSPTCPPSAGLAASGGLPEMEGVGVGATLWALFFAPKAETGKEIKIAWRMTGSGDLKMSASGPGGRTLRPSWGPEGHDGSSWHKPGDEWGTGWVFPKPGCWTFHAARKSGSGSLTIRVA